MSTKKKAKRKPPAIVPRFLKSAMTVGVIPAAAFGGSACVPSPPPPVVAQMATPYERTAEPTSTITNTTGDAGPPAPPPPVVAAYVPPPKR